jgi:hypothetical protein
MSTTDSIRYRLFRTNEQLLATDATAPNPATDAPVANGPTVVDATEPTFEELAAIQDDVVQLIHDARKTGNELAAENLDDWLVGRYADGTKSLPSAPFEVSPSVARALETIHRPRIRDGVAARLAAPPEQLFPPAEVTFVCREPLAPAPNDLASTGQTTLYYEDGVYPDPIEEPNLFYGLGAFSLLSTVTVSVAPSTTTDGWLATVDSWECRLCDRYDWDVGKAVTVVFVGEFSDADLQLLEEYGDAAPYEMETSWTVSDGALLEPFVVD